MLQNLYSVVVLHLIFKKKNASGKTSLPLSVKIPADGETKLRYKNETSHAPSGHPLLKKGEFLFILPLRKGRHRGIDKNILLKRCEMKFTLSPKFFPYILATIYLFLT